jgi:hypothetical protein
MCVCARVLDRQNHRLPAASAQLGHLRVGVQGRSTKEASRAAAGPPSLPISITLSRGDDLCRKGDAIYTTRPWDCLSGHGCLFWRRRRSPGLMNLHDASWSLRICKAGSKFLVGPPRTESEWCHRRAQNGPTHVLSRVCRMESARARDGKIRCEQRRGQTAQRALARRCIPALEERRRNEGDNPPTGAREKANVMLTALQLTPRLKANRK